MTKYINANDVYDGMRNHGFEAEYITRGEFVDSLPSADVVEVVRCEKCEFYDKERNGGIKKYGYCEIYKGYKKEEGFCDVGERRETE